MLNRFTKGSFNWSVFRSRFKKTYPDDYAPPEGIVDAFVKAGLDEGAINEIANGYRTIIEER